MLSIMQIATRFFTINNHHTRESRARQSRQGRAGDAGVWRKRGDVNQDQYDEIERMKRQLDIEYDGLSERLQGILNYHGLSIPGPTRVAALRRA